MSRARKTSLWLTLTLFAALMLVAGGFWFVGRNVGQAVEAQHERARAEEAEEQVSLKGAAMPHAGETPGADRAPVETEELVAGSSTATLEVRVVSRTHRGAVVGAELVILDDGALDRDYPDAKAQQVATDRAGHARFELLANVPWRIEVEPTDEHGWAWLEVDSLKPGEEREIQIDIDTAGDVTWFGRVTLRGEPHAGTRVRLVEEGWPKMSPLQEAESDGTGLVHFTTSSWLFADVRADAPGIGLVVAELVDEHRTPATAQELPLWPVASLRCTVVEPAGSPIDGLEVTASVQAFEMSPVSASNPFTDYIEVRAVTDERGEALLTNIPAELPIGIAITRGEELLLDQPRALILKGGMEHEETFVIGGLGRVSGMVLHVDGGPVPGAWVAIFQSIYADYDAQLFDMDRSPEVERMAETDKNGRFSFDAVPYGAWYVGSVDDADRPQQFALAPRVELTGDSPHAEITLRMQLGHPIAGSVVDTEGNGIDEVAVNGWSKDIGSIGNLVTDDRGDFAFDPMPAGVYTIWTSHAEGFVFSQPILVQAGAQDVKFVLTRGVELRGIVVDAVTGAPVDDVTVSAYAPESERPHTFYGHASATDGSFQLSGLPPGEVALRATTEEGGVGILRGIRLHPDTEAPEVKIRLHAGIPVRVRYEGEATERVGIQGLQEGIAIIYIGTKAGEASTFHAMPGPLVLRVLGSDGTKLADDQELTIAAGDHPDVVLGGDG